MLRHVVQSGWLGDPCLAVLSRAQLRLEASEPVVSYPGTCANTVRPVRVSRKLSHPILNNPLLMIAMSGAQGWEAMMIPLVALLLGVVGQRGGYGGFGTPSVAQASKEHCLRRG